MAEMAEAIALAVRAGRPVRDAHFRDRGIARGQDNPGLVDFCIRQGALRDALRRHDRGRVIAIDPNGLIPRRNRRGRAEMVNLAVARLPGGIAGFAARDRRDIHAAIRHRGRFGDARIPVRPHRDRDTGRGSTGRMRPFEERFAG